jgi:small multidrug resistance family-3 protein
MVAARPVALFVVALFEIGGAWLVWQGIREHKGWIWIGAGVIAIGLYGVVATRQHDDNFGRILAAYGGIFVGGSIAWGRVADGYRPDRWDAIGALVCLAGMAVIMYAPRGNRPRPGRPRWPSRTLRTANCGAQSQEGRERRRAAAPPRRRPAAAGPGARSE